MGDCPVCKTADTTDTSTWCDNHRDPHNICLDTINKLRAEHRQGLKDAHAWHEANQRIAHAVRQMTLPGVRNKTVRVDALRDLITRVDGQGDHG
jgi:prophage maintenance system killer protein